MPVSNYYLPGITARGYETEQDLQQMLGLLMDGRSRTDDWHYVHVGDLVFWFWMVACHLNPKEHIRLWYVGERLVGYAMLGEDPYFDWQVLPEYEWCGIEEQALAWAESRLIDLCREAAQLWGGPMITGARQDNPSRSAFLARHGFRQEGDFSEVNMLCRLDGQIAEAEVPQGWQVRSLSEADAVSNRADVQREVWQPWTVGNVSAENYAYFMTLPGYERSLDVVTVGPDGVIAAYVNGWIDPVNRVGDLGPVGARPAYRRRGLTRAVLLECMRRMQEHGMDRVIVSTNNTPAIRLYESVGFTIVNQYLEYQKPQGG